MKFRLTKTFGEFKKNRVFDSFDGLVRGIYSKKENVKINFDDKNFFKLIKKRY